MSRQLFGLNKAIKKFNSTEACPRFPMFINVYDLFQRKGGNEEGGWWYDNGEPLESVKVRNKAQYKRVLNALRKKHFITNFSEYSLKDQYEHPNFERDRQRGYTSCAGGTTLAIKIEQNKATFWTNYAPYC